MFLILIIISNLVLFISLNKFFIKKNYLVDKKELIHKSFISKELVPISGGFLILFNIFFLNNNLLEKFFFLLIFFLGILSDLLIIKKPLKKFIFQFLIVIFLLIFSKVYILSTKIFFIDYFIQNKLFAYIFTAFCLLILINGSNFIDGVNTLVCGYYILVILAILYIANNNVINYTFFSIHEFLLPLVIVFIFNFFSKTYLGDSGTFLLSFVIGYYLINLYNININLDKYISPIFILLLLWYPAFENLFSIIRKFIYKKKPSDPDNYHLHHLIFIYLGKVVSNKKIINSFTGMLINLYNLLIFSLGAQFYNKTNFLVILILINIFIYLFTYFILLKKNTQKKII